MRNYYKILRTLPGLLLLGGAISLTLTSCEKLIDNNPSSTQLLDKEVFKDSITVKSAIAGIYSRLSGTNPYRYSLSTLPGFSADELKYVGNTYDAFINNALLSDNTDVSDLWSAPYGILYSINSNIEGITAGSGMTETFKNQAIGEARFLRALCNFYLVNLFGDVPLILSTDVVTNSTSARTASSEVYTQIINDLKFAQNNLPADYSASGNARTRANKLVATALLARVYLYQGNWTEAEAQATTLIVNPLFTLPTDLSQIFTITSKEAIFQFYNDANGYTYYASNMIPNPVTKIPKFVLTDQLINAFEATDTRKASWTASLVYNGTTFVYPNKYKSMATGANLEYYTVLRLAEQYLIRAEARAQQNNVTGAQADIFAIRNRAGLGTTSANDKASLLLAIEQERRIEFNCEWGHRWLDLKRTNRVNPVISAIKPGWVPASALYPIPSGQRTLNSNLTQNPSYN